MPVPEPWGTRSPIDREQDYASPQAKRFWEVTGLPHVCHPRTRAASIGAVFHVEQLPSHI